FRNRGYSMNITKPELMFRQLKTRQQHIDPTGGPGMANNNKTKNRAAYASNLKPSKLALAVSSCLAFPVLAQDTANTDDEAVKLERIEVTARRTVENLQTVPVAVTSLGEEQLAQRGIDNITSVQQYSPNTTLQVSRGTNSTLTAYIR